MASYCDRDEIKAAVEVVQAASTQNECQTAYVPPPKVSADQESWVKARIKTVVRAALLLSRAQEVRADQDIVICGIDGIANGAADSFVPTRYDTSLLRIITLRDSKVAEETCKYCGGKREPHSEG